MVDIPLHCGLAPDLRILDKTGRVSLTIPDQWWIFRSWTSRKVRPKFVLSYLKRTTLGRTFLEVKHRKIHHSSPSSTAAAAAARTPSATGDSTGDKSTSGSIVKLWRGQREGAWAGDSFAVTFPEEVDVRQKASSSGRCSS